MPSAIFGISYRVIALVAVVAFLAVSFVTSFSTYLRQGREIVETKQRIEDEKAEIARITDELNRWDDPDYVRAQARDRLGWVVPGETGYRVIGPDGQLLLGPVASVQQTTPPDTSPWYVRFWGSVQAADQPAPAPEPVAPPTPTPTTASTGASSTPSPVSPGTSPTGTPSR